VLTRRHGPLSRQVGLTTACVLIIGNEIGASIFILPGQLAALAGPGVFFSYLIAATLSLATIPLMAILGTSFQTSGISLQSDTADRAGSRSLAISAFFFIKTALDDPQGVFGFLVIIGLGAAVYPLVTRWEDVLDGRGSATSRAAR